MTSRNIDWTQVSRERKAQIARIINANGESDPTITDPEAHALNVEMFDETYVLTVIMNALDASNREITG